MVRILLIGGGVFVAVFAGGFLVLQQVNGRAAPPKPPDDRIGKFDPNAPRPKAVAAAAEPPPAPRPPLVLKRWPLPAGQTVPDRKGEITIVIDPTGPRVVTQTKEGAVAWDAETGARRPTARVESETTIQWGTGEDSKMVHVRYRPTNQLLVSLREAPTRDACLTPDRRRVIVVGYPATYPAATYVQIPSGKSTTYPAHAFKNVRLFSIGGDDAVGELGLRDLGLDDDVWAVAVAPDGESFFLVNPVELLQLNFRRAFGVKPLPPQPDR